MQRHVETVPELQPPKAVGECCIDQALVQFPADRQELQVGGQLGVVRGLVEVIAQHQAPKVASQMGRVQRLVESIAGTESLQKGGKSHTV